MTIEPKKNIHSEKYRVLQELIEVIRIENPDFMQFTAEQLAIEIIKFLARNLIGGYNPAVFRAEKDRGGNLKVLTFRDKRDLSKKEKIQSVVTISSNQPTKFATLRIFIGGRWSVENMRLFLSYIEDIYNINLTLELMTKVKESFDIVFSSPDKSGRINFLTGSPWIFPKDSSLQIRHIQYSSPGISDLGGLGVIVGHVKDFLMDSLKLVVTRDQRKLENQERTLKNQSLQIENVRNLVALAKEVGCTKAEVKELISWLSIRNQSFATLASQGKITSVQVINDEDEK